MQQAVQRIDHVAIIVKEENARRYADRLSAILGISFEEPFVNDDYGLLIIISWDAGLEIMAPTRQQGAYWDRLQRYGEGTAAIVFGVANMDEAIKRARENGATIPYEAKLNGNEPWLTRFSSFREARLSAFDENLSCSFTLSEIVPILLMPRPPTFAPFPPSPMRLWAGAGNRGSDAAPFVYRLRTGTAGHAVAASQGHRACPPARRQGWHARSVMRAGSGRTHELRQLRQAGRHQHRLPGHARRHHQPRCDRLLTWSPC
jgi:catechol 2,3-dioxygenase-like lactoylglutathione lyase family enzyme